MITPSFSAAAAQLHIDALSVSFGDRRVIDDVSFAIAAGDRVGLIGENGSGKSTLLRTIAGLQPADAGQVRASAVGGAARIGLLHQDAPFAPTDSVTTVLGDAVSLAVAARTAVTTAAEAIAAHPDEGAVLDAYADAMAAAERLDVWNIETSVETTLVGLGIAHLDRTQQTGSLSGGERARLALAWLLLRAPDVLLLDEPTNHLDDAAVGYLTTVLRTWRGPALIASHDRAFLDETVTELIDLDPAPRPHRVGELDTPAGITRFSGPYSEYLRWRAMTRERWERQFRDEQAVLRRLRSSVNEQQQVGHADWKPRTESRIAKKFYGDRNAKVVSRRVNDVRARLDEQEANQVRKPPAPLRFTLANRPTGPRDANTIAVAAARLARAGQLAATSFSLTSGEQLLVTGENGAGKSTLLRLISGARTPTAGSVTVAPGLRVGTLSQEVAMADPRGRGNARTAAEAYLDGVGADLAERFPLAAFGLLPPRDHDRPLAVLSLGQQRRLQLAMLLADAPDVLLLDEPTNHLSLTLVTELEQAIAEYPGTVVIATHDRWLRERWQGRTLELARAAAR